MKKTLIGAAVALGFACAAQPAHALVVINVTESGGSLNFNASGSLDLTGALNVGGFGSYNVGFISGGSNWYVGPGNGLANDTYAFTTFDGPFGTNTAFFNTPTTSTGDTFFIWGDNGGTPRVGVATGYQSGGLINSSMTFVGLTIAGVGILSGTYNYALPNDKIVLNIGKVSAVPLPAALPLFATGLAGIVALARKRRRKTR